MDTVVLLSLVTGLASGALAAWVVARGQFRRDLTESISTHQATIGAAQALLAWRATYAHDRRLRATSGLPATGRTPPDAVSPI